MIWQTRTLATFIAATIPTEDGKESDAMKAAKSIGDGVLPETDTTNNRQTSSSEDYVDENGNHHKFNSFEHMMSRWGNPKFINKVD